MCELSLCKGLYILCTACTIVCAQRVLGWAGPRDDACAKNFEKISSLEIQTSVCDSISFSIESSSLSSPADPLRSLQYEAKAYNLLLVTSSPGPLNF